MSGHALFSPSSAPRWMRCPGSIALSYGAPDGSSEYADEGTAAHTLASWCLTAKQPDARRAAFYVGQEINVYEDDGKTVRRTFEVTDEMVDNVQAYVDAIERKSGAKFIEQRVHFGDDIGVPDQSGTGDAIVIDAPIIDVNDLKYGRGVKVSAGYRDEDGVAHPNEQLALYALGAYREHELVYDLNSVKLTIHQPRIDNFDEFELTVDELRAFGQSARAAAAEGMSGFTRVKDPINGEEILKPLAPAALHAAGLLRPGDKQCTFCKGADKCPALRAKAKAMVLDELDKPIEPMDVPLEEVPSHEELELLETFIKAWRSRIQRELQAGKKVKGWKLVRGKLGARQWLKERYAEAEKVMKKLLKKAAYTQPELISPTQAEKELKKLKRTDDYQLLKPFITQPEGGEHVAPESDARPAIVKEDIAALLSDDADLI